MASTDRITISSASVALDATKHLNACVEYIDALNAINPYAVEFYLEEIEQAGKRLNQLIEKVNNNRLVANLCGHMGRVGELKV